MTEKSIKEIVYLFDEDRHEEVDLWPKVSQWLHELREDGLDVDNFIQRCSYLRGEETLGASINFWTNEMWHEYRFNHLYGLFQYVYSPETRELVGAARSEDLRFYKGKKPGDDGIMQAETQIPPEFWPSEGNDAETI